MFIERCKWQNCPSYWLSGRMVWFTYKSIFVCLEEVYHSHSILRINTKVWLLGAHKLCRTYRYWLAWIIHKWPRKNRWTTKQHELKSYILCYGFMKTKNILFGIKKTSSDTVFTKFSVVQYILDTGRFYFGICCLSYVPRLKLQSQRQPH